MYVQTAVTRFIDSLVNKGYLIRQRQGKTTSIYPTETGEQLESVISEAWKSLYNRYANILGQKEGVALTAMIDAAGERLSKHR